MTEKCICNEPSERHGQYRKPVRLCSVHGDPDLLTMLDMIKDLQSKVDLIFEVDQKRVRGR